MDSTIQALAGWRDVRAWAAVFLLLGANYVQNFYEALMYSPLAHFFHVHHMPFHTLGKRSYGVEMLLRLVWDLGLWAGVCGILQRSLLGFPFHDSRWYRFLGSGLATGLAVMLATMLGIWGLRSASVSSSGQSVATSFENGCVWLTLDFVGALGEEILGRASVLVVSQRFLGWKGAVLFSGLMFSGLHLRNPGASPVWLMRLFLQGVLLAYAVFRTKSLWWSAGYHTGWNWISAPLFGAAGSGYLDEGHIFDFAPHGSAWITGGTVGPEGSLLAFLAVFVALVGLLVQTRRGSSLSTCEDANIIDTSA